MIRTNCLKDMRGIVTARVLLIVVMLLLVGCKDDSSPPMFAFNAAAPSGDESFILSASPEDKTIILSWDLADDALSYNLYWSNDIDAILTSGNLIACESTSYIHENLTNDLLYYYRVAVVTEAGEGLLSNVAAASPCVNPLVSSDPSDVELKALSCTDVKITWKDNAISEDRYEIVRRGGVNSYTHSFTLPPDSNFFVDTGLQPGENYNYTVRAFSGNSFWGSIGGYDITLPPEPSNAVVRQSNERGGLVISRSGGSDVMYYNIYWSTAPSSSVEDANVIEKVMLPYEHNNLDLGVTYYYRLEAIARNNHTVFAELGDEGFARVRDWPFQLGSDYSNWINAIEVDGSGNIICAGVGGYDPDSHAVDHQLIKFDALGNVLWKKSIGAQSIRIITDLFVAENDVVYWVGYDEDKTDGCRALWWGKYADNGDYLGAHRVLGNVVIGQESGVSGSYKIAKDEAGYIYIAGRLDISGYTSLWGDGDYFVRKIEESTNKAKWTIKVPYESEIITHNNNLYCVGETPVELRGCTQVGGNDLFIFEVKSDDSIVSAKQFGSSADDSYCSGGLTVNGDGNVVVAGYSEGSVEGSHYSSAQDIFVIEFGPMFATRQISQFATGNDYVVNNLKLNQDMSTTVMGTKWVDGNHSAYISHYSWAGVNLWSGNVYSDDSILPNDSVLCGDWLFVGGRTDGDLVGYNRNGNPDAFLAKFDLRE